MAYTLILGQKAYSSWSMRAWLLLRHLGVPFEEVTVDLYTAGSRDAVRRLGGQTGLVPVLKDDDLTVWDTLAIFEHLHEAHRGVWPTERARRARARSLSGEVHSGFQALRAAMPVNTRARGRKVARTPDVQADIARVVEIWEAHAAAGGWLCGDFGGADIMFAPIATRFLTYGVALSGVAGAYQARILGHSLVAEWLRLGEAEPGVIAELEVGLADGQPSSSSGRSSSAAPAS